MNKLVIACAAVALSCIGGMAQAQTELVTNGSFEAGVAGWTTSGVCTASARTTGNAYSFQGTPSPAGPTDGANYVELFPNGGSQTCYLYQDIAIPAGQAASLSVDASASFNGLASSATYGGAFRVMTPANLVLATPFVRDGGQASAPDLATYTADLTPYAGQTVRLAFEMTNGIDCCNVTFGDRVSVLAAPPTPTVPTLSEWAMILFGALLAGGAALYVQRRRIGA